MLTWPESQDERETEGAPTGGERDNWKRQVKAHRDDPFSISLLEQ